MAVSEVAEAGIHSLSSKTATESAERALPAIFFGLFIDYHMFTFKNPLHESSDTETRRN